MKTAEVSRPALCELPLFEPEFRSSGSTPASGVAGRASRPAFCARGGREHLELLGAPAVFREGAENGTRGACAPHSNFGIRVESTPPAGITARSVTPQAGRQGFGWHMLHPATFWLAGALRKMEARRAKGHEGEGAKMRGKSGLNKSVAVEQRC